jgi:hypothetical protein
MLQKGKPKSGVLAFLIPAKNWENLTSIRLDQSDSDGTFTWPSLPPGDYLMFGFTTGDGPDITDPEKNSWVRVVPTLELIGAWEAPIDPNGHFCVGKHLAGDYLFQIFVWETLADVHYVRVARSNTTTLTLRSVPREGQ